MWFKHGTILGYAILYLLSVVVDIRAHDVCGYFRVLLYLSVHRRTVLVVTQLRCEPVSHCVCCGMGAGGWGGVMFEMITRAAPGVCTEASFSATRMAQDCS